MAYNNLSGAVPQKLYNKTSLSYLGLSVNQLVGRIPSDIGNTLPNILLGIIMTWVCLELAAITFMSQPSLLLG